MTVPPARRAALAAAGVLLVVYVLTMAPGVTLWDAGEFLAAAHTLGIPHPPGTPLFVMLARVALLALAPVLGPAVPVNLLSAVCTAGAGGIAALLVARWTRSPVAGVAAALCAGSMSTVWLSATETEVYASALLLAFATLAAADRAGRGADPRALRLVAYLFALAVPLHLSALVAAPAAIALAASAEDGTVDVSTVLSLGAMLCAAAAIGTVSWAALGGAVTLAAAAPLYERWRPALARRPVALGSSLALLLLGCSAVFVLLVRARLDPAIDQGHPATVDALVEVIGRRQYAVAGLWPRQAPLWLQLGNLFEYADWQVALGLAPGVQPSWLRTPITLAFAALGIVGARAHRRADARSWRALLVLAIGASVGVSVYLNFKAGPSFGYGILPDDADREARERDYFFVFAFYAWGLWAGIGAMALVRRLGRRGTVAGVAIACLPIALNWRAVSRRAEPDASLPRTLAVEMLRSAPGHAVLFSGGDNDSYPLWYAQQAERVRPDVTVLTIPLLPAPWYRAELARRDSLLDAGDIAPWPGQVLILRRIAERARTRGRPIAASLTLDADDRAPLGDGWTIRGLVTVPNGGDPAADRAVTAGVARDVAPLLLGPPRESTDRIGEALLAVLRCPSLDLAADSVGAGHSAARALLDSTCKLP